MKSILIIIALCFTQLTLPLLAIELNTNDFDATLKSKISNFLAADTKMAGHLLHKFTNSDLENITTNYQDQLDNKGKRIIWLIEEGLKREQQRKAERQLFYLFLAILSLMVLILLFVFYIFQAQKKMSKTIETLQ